MTRPAATQQPTTHGTLAAARRHRAELLQVIQAFEIAIAVPARDPGWRDRVHERVLALRDAFGEHVVVTEGPEGPYAERREHPPRLMRSVHGLVREHAAIISAIEGLTTRVEAADIERLRGWSSDLLRELARHRQRGADLVYEAYATDIGGET